VVGVYGNKRTFSFKPKDHVEIGHHLDLFDFALGTAIAKSGFVVFKNDGALLELALVNYALSKAARSGFTPMLTPDLGKASIVEGCGFNPRDGSSQIYMVQGDATSKSSSSSGSISSSADVSEHQLSLLGTSEIALAGQHADKLFSPSQLPLKYAAFSHCFRKEAGAGGTRDKGLYRLHQFSKVELFAFVDPSSDSTIGSESMFSSLTQFQIELFSDLGIHFRVLEMPTEELGASAHRKWDMEAWMPCRSDPTTPGSLGAYGEISSTSDCSDFQSRRLNVRVKKSSDNVFVHTLNATALAVPRIVLTLLETHQLEDGSVRIPDVLLPLMGGKAILTPLKSK
jgi:seryl-tRNA synthetase